MKKFKKQHTFLLLLLISFFIASCDKMDDIHKKFTDIEEQVYLGKVDSIKAYPGFGRTKITWYIGSDPRVEKTIIYWNMKKDSIVKDFTRTSPGIQKDSIFIENLPEGSTLIDFRNINSKGETSLFSSITTTVWGTNFADKLQARRILDNVFDYEKSEFKLKLSPTYPSDHIIYSQIVYNDNEDVKRKLRIERDSNEVILDNFPDGEDIFIQSIFFLTEGIDTVYNTPVIKKTPKVIFETGKKISIGGGLDSRYFNIDGRALGEWNSAGDLIIYEKGEEENFTVKETYPGLISHADFREFFFYDDDKYIAINTGNNVSMHIIEDGELHYVNTPAGASTFGAGFTFSLFLPSRGYFYSFSALTDSELKTWIANNNATWGTPNGTTVATGISYNPVTLFKYQYMVGVDEDGYLWANAISTTGNIGAKSKNGSGWDRFNKIITVGDVLLGMDEDGDFWQFDFDLEHYWIVN